MSFSPDPVLETVASYEHGAGMFSERTKDRAPLAHLHKRFAELLSPGARILDLGCGPAHDAALLADQGFVVTGCDLTKGLLVEAEAYRAVRGKLVLGDARVIPFTPEAFQGIWACASLLHIPKPEIGVALAEAFRIMAPGGVLCTSMQEGAGDGMALVGPDDPLPGRRYAYYRAEEWLLLVESAGFELIEQRLKRTTEHVNDGATGWIETFARRPL